MTDKKQYATAKERQAAYIKELHKRQAALRPKISKEEAARRRAKSLRNFKLFEVVSLVLLTAVLVFLSYHIFQSYYNEDAYKAVLGSDATFNLTLIFWGAITLQAALMIRTGFVRNAADNLISEDKTDHPFKGWRFTLFTPLLGVIILLPAILAGVFNDDDINTVGVFFLMLLMSCMAFLLSALVAAFIIAPIELLIRGVVALIKGDRSKVHYVLIGTFIAGLTAFIVLGSMSVAAELPYPAGSFQVLLALFGIPGGYEVTNETLLWVTRGILAAIIGFWIIMSLTGKKEQPATSTK